MKEKIKAILDEECLKESRCSYGLDAETGNQSRCWLCHRNDRLTQEIMYILTERKNLDKLTQRCYTKVNGGVA